MLPCNYKSVEYDIEAAGYRAVPLVCGGGNGSKVPSLRQRNLFRIRM